MDFQISFAKILAVIISLALPLSILSLIVGAVFDLFKRKFYWTKFALIFLAITIIILIVLIKLNYQIVNSIL